MLKIVRIFLVLAAISWSCVNAASGLPRISCAAATSSCTHSHRRYYSDLPILSQENLGQVKITTEVADKDPPDNSEATPDDLGENACPTDLCSSFQQIPYSLLDLQKGFSELTKITDENPEKIGVSLLVEANGKIQTITTLTFLKNLEQALRSASKKTPKLSCFFDSWVAVGSAVIPAAVGALGQKTQEYAVEQVSKIKAEQIHSGSARSLSRFFNFAKTTAKSILSKEKPNGLVDKNGADWNLINYDRFNLDSSGNQILRDLFGQSSTADLDSSLGIVSRYDIDQTYDNENSIMNLVITTITNGDNDSKAMARRIFLEDLISSRSKTSTGSQKSKRYSIAKLEGNFSDELNDVYMIEKKAQNAGSISELNKLMFEGTAVRKNLLILDVLAIPFEGKTVLPCFSYEVMHTKTGNVIVVLYYKFSVPNSLQKCKTPKEIDSAISPGVNSVFPRDSQAGTNVSIATKMLIDFLNDCSDKFTAMS